MRNKAILTGIFLVMVSAILFWPSDEKKIRENLDSLSEYCSSTKEESVIETLQKATMAARLCTDPCEVTFEALKIDRKFGEKELTDHILMMKKRLSDTAFSFHDTDVSIAGDKAEVLTTLRIHGGSVDENFTDAYEIGITVGKKGGAWQFFSFTVNDFMKK